MIIVCFLIIGAALLAIDCITGKHDGRHLYRPWGD